MAGSMKDIKLRIKSVESTMQITKAMELVASSKMRRAKERVEHSRPYFETLHETLTKIAAADPRARNPYLRRDESEAHPAHRDCRRPRPCRWIQFQRAQAGRGRRRRSAGAAHRQALGRVFRPSRSAPVHAGGAAGGR